MAGPGAISIFLPIKKTPCRRFVKADKGKQIVFLKKMVMRVVLLERPLAADVSSNSDLRTRP